MKLSKFLTTHLYFCLFLWILLFPWQYVVAKQIVGWVEKVRIAPGKLTFPAKLDTGAGDSSINAYDLEEFKRDGKHWIRFVISNHRKKIKLERPIHEKVRILRHFGRYQRRPVVLIGICLGNVYHEAPVNLVTRRGFAYPMLIGRSFLKNEFLVDSALKHTLKPQCAKVSSHGQ